MCNYNDDIENVYMYAFLHFKIVLHCINCLFVCAWINYFFNNIWMQKKLISMSKICTWSLMTKFVKQNFGLKVVHPICSLKIWDWMKIMECRSKCHVETLLNSLFAKYKSPVCHIILGHTGIGATFRSTMFNSLYLFTCISYGKFQKAKLITHADSANQKQW